MTDEQKQATIISFADRSKIAIDVGPTPEELKREADEATVKAVEKFLEQAKSGKLRGFVAIAWNEEYGTFDRAMYLPGGKDFILMSNAYMGGMRHLLDDLSGFIDEVTEPEYDDDGDDE